MIESAIKKPELAKFLVELVVGNCSRNKTIAMYDRETACQKIQDEIILCLDNQVDVYDEPLQRCLKDEIRSRGLAKDEDA